MGERRSSVPGSIKLVASVPRPCIAEFQGERQLELVSLQFTYPFSLRRATRAPIFYRVPGSQMYTLTTDVYDCLAGQILTLIAVIRQSRTGLAKDASCNLVADYRSGPESQNGWTALLYVTIFVHHCGCSFASHDVYRPAQIYHYRRPA